MLKNCIAQIEARVSSVSPGKARQPQGRKGKTAEASEMPEFFLLGLQRISAGLSQTL